MIGALLATVSVVLGSQSAPTKPEVDRSGEPAFRRVLTWAASLDRVHGMVIRSTKESSQQIFYPDGIVEFWMHDGKFRVAYGDMWGTNYVVVGDGKLVLEDLGVDPVTLRKAEKTVVESSGVLDAEGSAATPFFYLVQGPALLDRMDKNRAITASKAEDGTPEIVWDSGLFGKTRIRYEETPQGLEVRSIEFDNMPQQRELFESMPEWYERPDPEHRWRHSLVVTPLKRVRRDLFDTKPGRQREVNDLTATGTKPPKI